MEQERELEPMEDVEESEEETFEELVGERSKELFGHPAVPPSFYHCAGCNEGILAQDIVWDRESQPRCPACHALLERQGSSKAVGGSEALYLVEGPLE
jgi:rubrerythrin